MFAVGIMDVSVITLTISLLELCMLCKLTDWEGYLLSGWSDYQVLPILRDGGYVQEMIIRLVR